MNQTQINYLTAKANKEAAQNAHDEYADSIEHLFDNIEAWDAAMEDAPEYLPALNDYLEAEDALIEWAMSFATRNAFLDQQAEVNQAVQIIRNTSNVKARQQVAEAALKL